MWLEGVEPATFGTFFPRVTLDTFLSSESNRHSGYSRALTN